MLVCCARRLVRIHVREAEAAITAHVPLPTEPIHVKVVPGTSHLVAPLHAGRRCQTPTVSECRVTHQQNSAVGAAYPVFADSIERLCPFCYAEEPPAAAVPCPCRHNTPSSTIYS